MLNRIKNMADELNINIVYGNLPGKEQSLYIEWGTLKLIIINKEIEGTDLAIEEIALNLGYIKVMDHLGVKVKSSKKAEELKGLATKCQLDLISTLYLQKENESFANTGIELVKNIKELERGFQ